MKSIKFVVWIAVDIILGVALLLIFSKLEHAVESLSQAHLGRQFVYDLVQTSGRASKVANEIVVVDISGIAHQLAGTHGLDFTDRKELALVVDRVLKGRPCAIGIDIDFDHMLHPNFLAQRTADNEFFTKMHSIGDEAFHCKGRETQTSRQGHIFLGAHQVVRLGQYAFGNPQFANLVAFIGFPNAAEHEGRKKMVQTVEVPMNGANSSGPTIKFPSLSAALAASLLPSFPPELNWAFDLTIPSKTGSVPTEQFFLDYKPIEQFEKHAKTRAQVLKDNDQELEKIFFQKYVLIGHGLESSDSADRYQVPGSPGKLFAGVFVHACAVYTLLRNGLFALSERGNRDLNWLLTFLSIFVMAFVRWKLRNHEHARITKWVSLVMPLLCTVLLLGAALGLAYFGPHALWDGFLLTVGVTWVHWFIESKFEHHLTRIKETVSEWFEPVGAAAK